MDKNVEVTISDYIEQQLFGPYPTWPEYYFKQRSYSKWATDEILDTIRKNPQKPVDLILNEFIDKCDYFATLDKNLMFFAAKETAEDILYIFLKGE